MTDRLVLLALLLLPGSALGHSPIKGLGDFYNGLLHPLFVPAHLLLVVALGLLIGQQRIPRHGYPVWGYLGGVILGLIGGAPEWFLLAWREAALLCSAVVMGLLVVLALRLPLWLLVSLGLLTGLLLGVDSLQLELTGRARAVALFGSGVGLFLLLLFPMVLAEGFQRHPWLRVGVRVIASWVTASALLVLALLLASA